MSCDIENTRIGIIGLGLPLAVEFGKKYQTVGFDINPSWIEEPKRGHDSTPECSDNEIMDAIHLNYSANLEDHKKSNVYVVTIPTPIDQHQQPDLTPLIKASEALGSIIHLGNVIVYESTVYPRATEDVCIPVVEKASGLVFNQDFFAGYSLEKVNPGDKEHVDIRL